MTGRLCKQAKIGCILAVFASSLSAPAFASDEAAMEQARTAYEGGEYPEAEALYEHQLQALGSLRNDAYLSVLQHLAECYYMGGQFSKAQSLYERAVTLAEELHGSEDLRVADNLFNLTRALRRQYMWIDAQPVIERTLSIRRHALGETHKLTGMSWLDLAVNLQREGKLNDSETAFQKSIAIRETNHDLRSAAIAYLLYAKLLRQLGRVDEADKFRDRAYAINGIREMN